MPEPETTEPVRCYAHPEHYVWGDLVTREHREFWTEFVSRADHDRIVAELKADIEHLERERQYLITGEDRDA